ncbi:MAG TPA: DUF6174 domain-containing protein [Longimicrobium sp.]|nr:DUF6174 domain-containing protein [Longimicrobium sp.]
MIRCILLLAALALSACGLPTDSATPVPGDPRVQRQVWERQGIDDYRFSFGRTCFCTELPALRVEVRNGRISDVRELESGRLVARERWDEIPTVDALFDRIDQAQAQGEYNEASYHPTLGYPMRAVIGTLANDAGVSYTLDDLREID